MKKVDHVILFCERLLEFWKTHPDLWIFNIIQNLPTARYKTPFDRDPKLNNLVVQEMRERFGKAIMKKVYLMGWEFVNVISYDSVFIEQLNIVDDEYETIYNILWDDIIYTPFLIPTCMIKFKTQRHLYLRKKETSI